MKKYKNLLYSLVFVTVTVAMQLANVLLLRLSQYGQNPFEELPWVVVAFLGVLFLALIMVLKEKIRPENRPIVLIISIIVNILVALLNSQNPSATRYLLSPFLALALAEIYPRLFKERAQLFADISVYVMATLLANFTFDSFLPLPKFGLVNVGTLFFAITFTQRDRIHQYGRKYALLAILIAAIANVITALSLATPLRYVIVGFTAIILSEFADTEVYQRLIKRNWLTRVIASNTVSIPIDTIIFTVFAFYGEDFANFAWMREVIITDIFVKAVVALIVALGLINLKSKFSSRPSVLSTVEYRIKSE